MQDRQVNVSITTGTLLTAITVAACAYAAWLLRDLILLVLVAVVIASAIEPGVVWLKQRGLPRPVSVLLMYLTVFGSAFATIYFFLPPIIDDAGNLFAVASKYLEGIDFSGIVNGGHLLSGTSDAASHTSNTLDSLLSFRSAFTEPSAGAFRLVTTFFGGIFSLVLVIVLSFYFAIQDTGIEDFLKLVTPVKHEEYVVSLWLRAQRKIGLWMQGQLLSSLIGGVIAYLGLLILGIPYALLMAVFTAVAMLVPIFGSFVSAVPAVVVAFSTGDFTLALIVAGLYLIINQFEAHLVHPLVVNKVVGIPPLLVILALIVGGELAGFLGVVLAIPVAAALREFLTDIARGRRAKAT